MNNFTEKFGESIANTTTSILDLIANAIQNAEPLPPIGEPLPPLAPLPPVDQAALDAIGSIFKDGFKNIGIFRMGSRNGSGRRL